MTTENPVSEKTPAEASDKGVGCRDLLGEGESQTPRTDAEILLCSDGTTVVPASLARIMERDIAMLTKCHEDNCCSISQLADELGRAREVLEEIEQEASGALNNDAPEDAPDIVANIQARAARALAACMQPGSLLAKELAQSRDAERLARMQLEKARGQRDELRALARAVEPFAAEQACNRREMAVHDACRKMRPLIYDEPAMSDNDARIVIGRTAKRGGWNA